MGWKGSLFIRTCCSAGGRLCPWSPPLPASLPPLLVTLFSHQKHYALEIRPSKLFPATCRQTIAEVNSKRIDSAFTSVIVFGKRSWRINLNMSSVTMVRYAPMVGNASPKAPRALKNSRSGSGGFGLNLCDWQAWCTWQFWRGSFQKFCLFCTLVLVQNLLGPKNVSAELVMSTVVSRLITDRHFFWGELISN